MRHLADDILYSGRGIYISIPDKKLFAPSSKRILLAGNIGQGDTHLSRGQHWLCGVELDGKHSMNTFWSGQVDTSIYQ